MHRKYLPVFTLVLLAAAVALVLLSRRNSTLPEGIKTFIPPDIGKIDRICITQQQQQLVLEKTEQGWTIPQRGPVQPERIAFMLAGMSKMERIAPVSNLYRDEIARDLVEKGRRIEIYQRGRLVRSFFMDYDSLKVKGTSLVKNASGIPVMVKLRGYPAMNLMELFSTEVSDYVENSILGYGPAQILEITLLYPGKLGHSFSIEKIGPDKLVLTRPDNPQMILDADPQELSDYLHFFAPVYCDPNTTVRPGDFASQQPFAILTVRIEDGVGTDLQAYARRSLSGESRDVDRNFYIAILAGGKDTVLIRYSDTDPLFRLAGDFQKK